MQWGFFLDLGPRVLQRQRPIEHRLARRRIGIDAEITDALKLEWLSDLRFGE